MMVSGVDKTWLMLIIKVFVCRKKIVLNVEAGRTSFHGIVIKTKNKTPFLLLIRLPVVKIQRIDISVHEDTHLYFFHSHYSISPTSLSRAIYRMM